ncbi:MAG: hypothetical protein M0019_01060 [Actinomycetota bacterium]|nr:hypothetical protein [Actinomycetota bacterium]
MTSPWQNEMERRRDLTAEREAENLELRRRTSIAESTLTHQISVSGIDELFVKTRDSSLATAHIRFVGKKKPSDIAKYVGFRVQNFYLWHLVHQFNNFTQSLLKVEQDLIERLTSIEERSIIKGKDLVVLDRDRDGDRIDAICRLIDDDIVTTDHLDKGKISQKLQPTKALPLAKRASLVVGECELPKEFTSSRPWVFSEISSRPSIDKMNSSIAPGGHSITDLAISIKRRTRDGSLAKLIVEGDAFEPNDLLWLIQRLKATIMVDGEIAILLEESKSKISLATARTCLENLGFSNTREIHHCDGLTTVAALNSTPKE